jgi:hypothetical protein
MHETRANGASLQIDAVGIVGQLRQRQRPDQRVTVDQAEFQQARPLHVGDPSPSSAADSAGGPSSTVENGRLAVPREDDSPKGMKTTRPAAVQHGVTHVLRVLPRALTSHRMPLLDGISAIVGNAAAVTDGVMC